MAYLTKGRSIAAKEELSYSDPATIIADSDYFDYTAGDMSVDVEQIEREVLRNSLVKLAGIAGQETSSGNITVELSGDHPVSEVNGRALFKNGVGIEMPETTATTVASAVDGNNITLTDATGVMQGAMLKVVDAIVQVVSVTGNDVVVTPALTAVPAGGETAEGLHSFILPRPDDEVLSLLIREHLKPTAGDNIDYDYHGCMVDTVALDFPVGGIATADFSISGAGSGTTTPAADVVLSCETLTPVVGKNATVTVLGVPYTAQDLSVDISTTNTDILSITTDGITNKVGTEKVVTGTFKTEYTGTVNFDALVNSVRGEFHLQLRDGNAGTPVIVGVYIPQMKFVGVVRTDDAGILYDEVSFEAESPDCVGAERTITVYFA